MTSVLYDVPGPPALARHRNHADNTNILGQGAHGVVV